MDDGKKKQKKVKCTSEEWASQGESWAYTCIKRDSYFWVAFSVGKWTQDTCRAMWEKIIQRITPPTFRYRLNIFSDGNDDYQYVMPEFIRKDCINYGQLVKIKENGRLVRKIRRIIFGNPKIKDIETTDVENFNGIIRERVGRFVRRTKCFGKRLDQVKNALSIFQFYWNFIKIFKEKQTPAMLEHQTHKVWTWGNFLNTKLRYLN